MKQIIKINDETFILQRTTFKDETIENKLTTVEGKLHNPRGPAITLMDSTNKIIHSQYWLNGKIIPENQLMWFAFEAFEDQQKENEDEK